MTNAIKKMASQTLKPKSDPAPAQPVPPPAEAAPLRRPFGTKLEPRLHSFLKRFSVDLGEQIGTRQATSENVVNALLAELEGDPDLQARIRERCRR